MEKSESQKDMKIETVDRTLTVKLPTDFDVYLQALAKALNRTVENILLDELYGSFLCGDSTSFAECWSDILTQIENSERLENQIKQVADLVCDC